MFTRKTVAQLRAEAEAVPLKRTLGRSDLIILGIGAVIGSGIFVLPGMVAANIAGPAVVISFLIAGVAATLAALCYAEFASLTPVSGSAYTYAYATMGELFAWLIGWALLLEYTLGSALVAIGWGSYVIGFAARVTRSPLVTEGAIHAAAIFVTIASTLIVCAGVRRSAYATAVFVLIKLAVILLFVFFGLPFVNTANWHPFVPPPAGAAGELGWSGVLRGAGVMFVAYIGFDAVTTAAQEARDPQRDVPAGVLGALAISAVIYACVALTLTGLVRYSDLAVPNPMAAAIRVTGLPWVSVAVELGAIAALSSVLIVLIMGQARILLAMSRDGLLPAVLSRISARNSAPVVATVVTGVVVTLLTMWGSLELLGEVVSIGTFFAFVIVCIGVPILRRTDPDLPRSFRVPGSPVVPLLGAAACINLVLALPRHTWMIAGVWFTAGLVVYVVMSARRVLIGR